ncbi:enoyl-CoA hydratase/isomerase family protein [Roseovarius nubinhibens]|uniref:3-hydroxyacyl-CoA dehydrogenase NAD-binding domain-containing protein n=1 Tax=Roseovarius nubinhibens TaxID=314263 RepID=UPI001C08F003|nr:3-hydroxyacyl-CoA dehydrogenase NAD-binding domain-containing protein [Roseovarius nubinhibens]MBU2999870.1 enoyl-CoA hydratase/isomerase family protein [Roseovarius nubinhibens]
MAVTLTHLDDIAIATVDNPPVNAVNHAVREGLLAALAETEANPAIRATILLCAGRSFIAGADIREFGQPPKPPHLPDVIERLEGATKPWLAAIHGTALGGGLEIALGCHYRIAAPSARLGLPEVTLGLIPGAGGTVRLPRLIAAEEALEMISGGKPVPAAKALDIGLIDALAEGDLQEAALGFLRARLDAPLPTPLRHRQPHAPRDAADWDKRRQRLHARARGQAAPLAALEAIETALKEPADLALARERDSFLRLKSHPESAALRHVFFAERAAGQMPRLKDVAPGPLTQIGVIGGGTMGAGIAAACLLADLPVTLIERDEAACDAGRARVTDIIAGARARGLIDADRHAALLSQLATDTDYAALAGADLVIEAVFEDMDVKHAVFAALDAHTRPDCILASNTSYLDINEIARATAQPDRVIGLHFFSPAHVMKLLELIVTDRASDRALATGFALGKHLRKLTVPAGVCDGFIGNRILSSYRRDTDAILQDGATPSQIDQAMRDFGFPMGIFEMQDLAGLDISWAMRKRRAATRAPSERYVDIADTLCEAGRFGRKTGRGWYLYEDGKTPIPDPEVEEITRQSAAAAGITRRSFSDDEIISRILTTMQREGEKILNENIAERASDIDVVMINGYGFPRWRGGPMYMAGHRNS